MVSFKKKLPFFVISSSILHLPFCSCSPLREPLQAFNHSKNHNLSSLLETFFPLPYGFGMTYISLVCEVCAPRVFPQLSPKMVYEVTIHGVLLWASMGFLMPLGILIIRFSTREQSTTRLKLSFYFHLAVQILSVSVATIGAIMSIKTFENSFNNNHQRIGLALYGAIWVQAVIGFSRPLRGSKKRSIWYFLHWIIGTIICIVGILNIYTGLEAYKKRTKRSVTLWKVLFTAEICSIAFFYLLQDKWDYMQKQGPCLRDNVGQVSPDDPETSINHKDLWREPCSKVNALKNLFN